MNSAKKTEKTSSKFSGLLAQARTREEPDTPETEPRPSESSPDSQAPATNQVLTLPNNEFADAQQAIKSGAGRGRGKRSDPDFTQITAYIRVQTHQQVKSVLLREAVERANAGERGAKPRELSEIVEEMLQRWLNENNAQ